jgi:hypothetical protein
MGLFDEELLGEEEQEVADPVLDEGEEEQEVADPVSEEEHVKDERDSAFAEQRRAMQEALKRAEEAEARLADLNAEREARADVLRRLSGSEDADIEALAESLGIEAGDITETLKAEQEKLTLKAENEKLRQQYASVMADKEMQSDLIALQKIDPNIKDLSELGADFSAYISAGLSATQAYYAIKGKELNEKATPPAEIGKFKSSPTEKEFFTEKEVDAMTPEQQKANATKILASMAKW